jgi:SSS family solute:Na+ symporter
MLFIHSGRHYASWFISSVVASTIGIMFLAMPHMWPELLAARSGKALRRNYIFLPVYSLSLIFPILIGLAAVTVLHAGGDSNNVLFTLVGSTLVGSTMPGWLVGLVVVARTIRNRSRHPKKDNLSGAIPEAPFLSTGSVIQVLRGTQQAQ